jgi:hypothetical protein
MGVILPGAASVKGRIQQIIDQYQPIRVLRGRVTRVSPLEVTGIGDDKQVIPAGILGVPRHLTDYTVDVTIGGGRTAMTVHNALGVGDVVYVLAYNHNQRYLILDREAAV